MGFECGANGRGGRRGAGLLQRQSVVEVPPAGVEALDQFQLPDATPRLHRALAAERGLAAFEDLVVDEPMHAVLRREARDFTRLVLPDTAADAVRMADVK